MYSLLQPDATGDCCCRDDCGPCASGPSVTFTCVSRTGSGTLYGKSRFDNFNSGDWNTRKFHFVNVFLRGTTSTEACYTNVSPCSAYVGSIVLTINPSSYGFDTSGVRTTSPLNPRCVGGACVTYSMNLDASSYNLWYFTNIYSDGGSTTKFTEGDLIAVWRRTYSGFACRNTNSCGDHGYPGSWTDLLSGYYDIVTSLSVPDSVDDALNRGTSTEGTLCKTSAGTIGSTSVGAEGTLSISSATSVVATLAASGLTASSEYEIEITLKRYTAGGGGYLDSITDTITFTASGATEEIEYNVPVNTDYDYELSAASIAVA